MLPVKISQPSDPMSCARTVFAKSEKCIFAKIIIFKYSDINCVFSILIKN